MPRLWEVNEEGGDETVEVDVTRGRKDVKLILRVCESIPERSMRCLRHLGGLEAEGMGDLVGMFWNMNFPGSGGARRERKCK